MNESDTFLDDILDGVTTAPQPALQGGADTPAPPSPDPAQTVPATKATDLDQLLDGLSSPQDTSSNGSDPETPSPTGKGIATDDETVERHDEPVEVAGQAPASEVSAPPVELPVAAPHEILGLPDQSEVSHFDLANEVHGIAVAPPAVEARDSHSFAAIAREIAATVDDSGRHSNVEAGAEAGPDTDRASFYVRSAGRRRRRSAHRVTIIEVVGLVLLLVVGLAGEWEYVSRGHSNSTSGTGVVTLPSLPAVRLPKVTSTRVAGTYFQFQGSGSAESSAFTMTKPFTVAWTVRCGELPKTTSAQILFNTSGRSALDILIGVTSHTVRSGKSAPLRPGTYTLIAHTTGLCTWRAQGIPHA